MEVKYDFVRDIQEMDTLYYEERYRTKPLVIKKPYFEDGGNLSNQSYEELQNKLDDGNFDGFISNNKKIFVPKDSEQILIINGKDAIRGFKELERRVSEDMKVAFALYPTSLEEVMKISDKGLIMPPKSTWFEPKLRSGIFIHKI